MCLGIPGEVVELMPGTEGQLAMVDVEGARRPVNIGMLEDLDVVPGDWILIHVGFAVEKVSKEKAGEALAGLQMLGHDTSAPQ